jgi:hypothetical protein
MPTEQKLRGSVSPFPRPASLIAAVVPQELGMESEYRHRGLVRRIPSASVRRHTIRFLAEYYLWIRPGFRKNAGEKLHSLVHRTGIFRSL